MGEVFLARTPWPQNPLGAVKRLRAEIARVPIFSERFRREAELAVRLGHKNIVGTLDVGSVEGRLYVCSELVLGKDVGAIADRLHDRGQGAPLVVGLQVLLDVLAGLAYVHGARDTDGRPMMLVHRDVTPGNILIGYDGCARLADFGLAKSFLTESAELTKHGEILGTPSYLAPEVIQGDRATPASDLFGVGAVMYRFFAGVPPHQGAPAEVLLKALSERPDRLSGLRPDLPGWVVDLVHGLIDADPTRRPQSASELAKRIAHEVRERQLSVPRSAVARWLGELFREERELEVSESDALVHLDPSVLPDPLDRTMVLARPLEDSRFLASQEGEGDPEADSSLAPDIPDFDAAEATAIDVPSVDERTDLEGARLPVVRELPEDERTAIGPNGFQPHATLFAPVLLPPRTGPPAAGLEPALLTAEKPPRSGFFARRLDAPSFFARRLDAPGFFARRLDAPGFFARRLEEGGPTLFSMLFAAIALGIAIGVLVTTREPKTPEAAVLRDRLVRLKSEMDRRRAVGDSVPERAWALVGSAGVALAAGAEDEAKSTLVEIERLLVAPLVTRTATVAR